MVMDKKQVQLEPVVVGPLETNCYIFVEGSSCAVFDFGMWPKPIIKRLKELSASPGHLVITHGHADHIGGLKEMREHFPAAKVVCPRGDVELLASPEMNLSGMFLMSVTAPPPDQVVNPGEVLKLGTTEWQVLDTAGHTPGGVSYYCRQLGAVVTGDSLFAGGIGRTDFPGSDHELLIRNIRDRLLSLPDQTVVLPGHGPATTVGQEKRSNQFLF
ncbi:MAG: MBL fold metallo-hydrolase [Planctomycetes bacterium]|nr:MBL fold metallo-hydrolase [Planctomycetota bacterium]